MSNHERKHKMHTHIFLRKILNFQMANQWDEKALAAITAENCYLFFPALQVIFLQPLDKYAIMKIAIRKLQTAKSGACNCIIQPPFLSYLLQFNMQKLWGKMTLFQLKKQAPKIIHSPISFQFIWGDIYCKIVENFSRAHFHWSVQSSVENVGGNVLWVTGTKNFAVGVGQFAKVHFLL